MEDSLDEPDLPFLDRRAAGTQLARVLRPKPGTIILGIARGGVIVAAAVAEALKAPLDVLVIRKVGHPMQPELAIGAVSAHGEAVATEHASGFSQSIAQTLFNRARQQAQQLEERLRGDNPPLSLEGRPVIIVDDGIATSATMMCALSAARKLGASHITCAVPVAPADCVLNLRPHCDDLVVLVASRELPFAVGRYYFMFQEVTDARVRDELAHARARANAQPE
ncbi:MAG TPA: phosphoribosyltransferase family protein [Candidatus Eremiobacteraceae bacterium]|nr:phosphoribosyltransferase family protein [Candidatus Eremiobacteraceae bacterium]